MEQFNQEVKDPTVDQITAQPTLRPEATQPPTESTFATDIKAQAEQLPMTTTEGAQPIPAQNQLPADSFVYANTSNLGGAINLAAEQYGLDPHELEALTNTIRNKQADLSGFWKMQVGYYPGMSAESLVNNLAQVAELSNTDTANRKQKALLAGEKFNTTGMQQLVDSLQTADNKVPGKEFYHKTLDAIREADHVQFDTPALSNYYELQIKSGASRAQAWENTMDAQDKFRASQDTRAVMQDFNTMTDPARMKQYTDDLYSKIAIEKNPEVKLRMVGQWEASSKLTAQYTEAFNKDKAQYLQVKDPSFKPMLEEAAKNKDYTEVIKHLDQKYKEMGIPESERTYLTQTQAKAYANQINTFIKEDPSKAQAVLTGLTTSYKQGASRVLNQLIKSNNVAPEARILLEAARTGSASANGDVLDMLKHQGTLKGSFAATMFGTDNNTANTLYKKTASEVRNLPGYKALVQNLDMSGNVSSKIEMDKYYADMAAYYKYKNPHVSDKQIAQMVQTKLIDSVYTYDTSNRIVLQKRTLDGKPILYNKYTPEQATSYLTNRGFAGLGYTVGNQPHQVSDALLRNKNNVQFRVLDQQTVQPFYHDNATGANAPILDKHGKALKLNLTHLGMEDIVGTIAAKDAMRKTLKELYSMSGAVDAKAFAMSTGRLGGDPHYFDSKAYKSSITINTADKALANAKGNNVPTKELERTNLSERQIQALNKATVLQQEFEAKLESYQKLQRLHREMSHGAVYNGAQLIPAFFGAVTPLGKASRLVDAMGAQKQLSNNYKPELKKQREDIYRLEKEFMDNAAIFLDYKGELPVKPFTKDIEENLYEKMWYGGY